MTVERDALWADMIQFDPPSADRVWDGDLRDPDAPGWFGDLGSLIHRARGPAEPDELVDEPEVVATMSRASLGAAIIALPRRRGVRRVGRLVAMKTAAAATTAGMAGIAAAATTGIVATVAATVVVPAIHEKVRPVIQAHIIPSDAADDPASSSDPSGRATDAAWCDVQADRCGEVPAPVYVEAPPATTTAPAPETTIPVETAAEVAAVPVAAPVTPSTADAVPAPAAPVETEAVESPAEPVEPVEPVEPPPAETPPVDPVGAETIDPDAVAAEPAPADPAPVEPAPAEAVPEATATAEAVDPTEPPTPTTPELESTPAADPAAHDCGPDGARGVGLPDEPEGPGAPDTPAPSPLGS